MTSLGDVVFVSSIGRVGIITDEEMVTEMNGGGGMIISYTYYRARFWVAERQAWSDETILNDGVRTELIGNLTDEGLDYSGVFER